MIVVVDYGVGNLFSLISSLKAVDAQAVISGKIEEIKRADKIILPGVGAFGDAVNKLKQSGLFQVIIDRAKAGVPLLGICLGMQLLFEKSYEFGEYDGLGLIKGQIYPLKADVLSELKIPHIGWNSIKILKNDAILKYVNDGEHVYFVHSFYAKKGEYTSAISEYGVEVTASVSCGNVYGCQFHPEKSGEVGLKILKAFCEIPYENIPCD